MRQEESHPKILIMLLAAIIFAVGCSGSSDSPVPLPLAPQFDFTNGPATPGPVVHRTDDQSLFLWVYDPKAGLVSVFGIPLEDPANTLFCGGSEDLQSVDAQDLLLPSGAIARLFKGEDRNVVVYDGPSFLSHLPDICAAAAGGTVLARGTARIVGTDNDITGFGGPGINTWGATAHGVVQDETTGELLSFHLVARYQLTNDGTFRVVVSKITLGD